MTKRRMREAPVRIALLAALVAVFVVAGSSAAFALWSASGTTGSTVTLGKLAGTASNMSAFTTTFSSTLTSSTNAVTFSNSGTIAGTYGTAVSVVSGSSVALAQAVTVAAWPVTSASACTTSTAVGTRAVTGTWASLPSMSGSLASGASAVWCIRSSITSSAPASATTNPNLTLTLSAGSWTSVSTQGFYMNSPAAAAALTCVAGSGGSSTSQYYVTLTWNQGSRAQSTYYGAFINGTQIGKSAQGYSGTIQVAPSDVPSTVGTSGTFTVTISVLDSNYAQTSTTVGTGNITLYTLNASTAIRCGS